MPTSSKKTRIGCVSYLNSKPLLAGLDRAKAALDLSIETDYPANIADRLSNNTLDLGLIPVASMLDIPEAKIIGAHCISCEKCLLSKQKVRVVYIHALRDHHEDAFAMIICVSDPTDQRHVTPTI